MKIHKRDIVWFGLLMFVVAGMTIAQTSSLKAVIVEINEDKAGVLKINDESDKETIERVINTQADSKIIAKCLSECRETCLPPKTVWTTTTTLKPKT